MELDNEKTRKKPFKFLSGVFKRGRNYELKVTEDMLYGTEQYREPSPMSRSYTKGQTTPSRNVDLEEEMEELHLSRKDNPYLSSCEALDDPDFGDEPGSPLPSSPRQSTLSSLSPHSSSFSPESVSELHSHLIRSPPPVHWPSKTMDFETASTDWGMRSDSSDRAFSPESGSDGMETGERLSMGRTHGQRSHSVDRMISPGPSDQTMLSPVRGQTPALSPARGQTPDQDLSPPPYTRLQSTPSHQRLFTYTDPRSMSPRSNCSSFQAASCYQRTQSHQSQSQRLNRSKTPDEEFSPSRFNIYSLHQRGVTIKNKSESSYMVSSPGRDDGRTFHYQPASRRSLAQLASSAKSGPTRKSSTETFLSWIPRRSRSRGRADAKSMENLQCSPATNSQGVRNLRDTSKFSHKSLSCMTGDSAGLINQEGGGVVPSPRVPRNRFTSLKKSLSLKKTGGGPFYVDIDTQENL